MAVAFTTNQWAILALVLILGWLIGLLSRSGSAKWRRRYERERADRIAIEASHDARYRAANERIAELERHAPPVSGATAGSIAAAASGNRDDLSLIHGIGRDGETRLNDAGVHRYRDIEGLSPADEAALEGRLGMEPGHIERQQWREQAALLRAGKVEEHRGRFVP